MSLKLLKKSDKLPISLEMAKMYLRINHDKENDLLNHLISAATRWVEESTGKSLTQKTWKYRNKNNRIFLPNPPVLEIVEVKYRGKILTPQEYTFFDANGRQGIEIPFTYRMDDFLSVIYIAGYPEDYKDMPETLKNAILTTLAYLYENRGENISPKTENRPEPWIDYHRTYHL